MTDRRLLLVHAHPDDESSQSPATMARYVAEGARVTLVTCTLGEMGEILDPDIAHYSPEQLGQHRIEELGRALEIVGVTDHVFLGGPGRYHDSGMDRDESGRVIPMPELVPGSFWRADLLEAANHLVEVIRNRRPQVVSTYDPIGNYGHPDHIQTHRVTMYACQLAAALSHRPDLGEPWQVERILWSSHHTAVWAEGAKLAKEQGLSIFEGLDDDALLERMGPDPSKIAAVIGYGEYLDTAREALASHRSQVNLEDDFWRFFEIVRVLPGAGEAYVLAAGKHFPEGDGPADDLFAGLE